MEAALRDGHFLDYDPVEQSFSPNELRRAISQLVSDIRRAKQLLRGDQTWVSTLMDAARRANNLKTPVNVPGEAALWAQVYFDRAENVFSGLVALAGHLADGARSPAPPSRQPRSPIPDEAEGLWQEELEVDDVERLVRNQIHPFGPRIPPGLLSEQKLNEWATTTKSRLQDQYPGADLDNLLQVADIVEVLQGLVASADDVIEDRGR